MTSLELGQWRLGSLIGLYHLLSHAGRRKEKISSQQNYIGQNHRLCNVLTVLTDLPFNRGFNADFPPRK